MTSPHSRFRTSKKWKEFRAALLLKRGSRCECCGIPKKGLQLHHLYPEDYENLQEDRFSLLCSRCHDNIESFSRRLNGKKAFTIINEKGWMNVFGPFLPRKEN